MTTSQKNLRKGKDALAQPVDAAFEQLFLQHWEPVWKAIYRLVGDADEAEDIALEAFLKLHQNPPGRAENLAGWLYRVATHLGLNAIRARARRQRYENQAGHEAYQSSPFSNPEAYLELAQDRERVRTVLAKMKPRSAMLLLLRTAGLSYAEIAQALSVAPGSVGTLLVRAEKEFVALYNR